MNQDWPGNLLWEDLYNASPNAKVILTVRDSDEVWWKSMIDFMSKERAFAGNPGYFLFGQYLDFQLLGPLFIASDWLGKVLNAYSLKFYQFQISNKLEERKIKKLLGT